MTAAPQIVSAENPRRQPLHPAITEAMIEQLVHRFYAKVRADESLGPIFEGAIKGEWGPHLAKMCDFWSSIMLMTGRYKGKPLPMHMRLKAARPAHFDRWLALFRETAYETCPPDVAALFAAKSKRIADTLKSAMFFQPTKDQAAGQSL